MRVKPAFAAAAASPASRAGSQSSFTLTGNGCHYVSLRGAQRRSNPLPDEPRNARQAGDCFGAARLARNKVLPLPLREGVGGRGRR